MTRGPFARLGAILALVTLVYVSAADAFFSSYDDFFELHRAAFTYAPNPRLVFTTSVRTHFPSNALAWG